MAQGKSVLISGASFAGLATAYWMRRLGYDVTVVEAAPALKRGGTPVNIKDATVDVVRRMGLFEQIESHRIVKTLTEFSGPEHVEARFRDEKDGEGMPGDVDYEIERDVLLRLMYDTVEGHVEFVFNDGIRSVREDDAGVPVSFERGSERRFDLVFGCDGIHSNVRSLWFGPEKDYAHFLGAYGAVTIVDRLLLPEGTSNMYGEDGRFVSVNTYNGKTDIILLFASEDELDVDWRDKDSQRSIVLDRFATMGGPITALLAEVERAENFYFGPITQILMPAWTKGRVALVGDAGYCASPAAGKGGSLALDGAAASADALEQYGGDYAAAFAAYDAGFRPYLEDVQAGAVGFCRQVLGAGG